MAYIEFKDVIKAYGEGDARIHALDGASFSVERGELAIILGASGAGKTTALNILGGMDTATSGTVTVDGRDVSSANEAQLVEYRRADVGFVFQFYNLVGNLTALENVERGVGGEIQLTDAIAAELDQGRTFAHRFEGRRFDCGSKQGFLSATAHYARLAGYDFS